MECGDRSIILILNQYTNNPKQFCTGRVKELRETAASTANVKLRTEGNQNVDQLASLDRVATDVNSSECEAQPYIFEDNEAVIKMIIKGRSPMMIHVSRTHRVALDWLFDRINLDPKIQTKYVDTKNQLADFLN